MKPFKSGTWWLSSESDPRWNCSGEAHVVALGYFPREAQEKLDQLEATLGSRPEDLVLDWWKD